LRKFKKKKKSKKKRKRKKKLSDFRKSPACRKFIDLRKFKKKRQEKRKREQQSLTYRSVLWPVEKRQGRSGGCLDRLQPAPAMACPTGKGKGKRK